MENGKFSIIYVYDALCGWCYGFNPVIKQVFEKYQSMFDFEVISGGMVLGKRQGPIGDVAAYIKGAYKTVEDTTGVKFGENFVNVVLEEGKLYFSSEKPAIALSVFKTYHPEKAILFAHDLQFAFYHDGLDLSKDENYIPLAQKHQININDFIEKLNSEEFKQAAYYDFALAKQLQVNSYPAVLIKTGKQNFHMIAKGYTDLQTIELRIQNVIKETKS